MAPRWFARVQELTRGTPRPACVISSGETTVRVTGQGRGGRNLEFALALAGSMVSPTAMAMASVGTDGIDGSSGVAGGVVDSTTLQRASALNLDAPGKYLAANDSLSFFAPLDDVVRLGRTDTNVGDLQVILID
jgi:hydroxypyruvate reductase